MKKILLFDLETFPNVSYTWGGGLYEQNVIDVVREWELASFAYKWLGEARIRCHTREGQKNDKRLVQKLHKLISEADIVVAHNGDSFDIRSANARFIANGLTPPAPYKTIDTKKVAKKYFRFNSNSLNHLGTFLGVGNKQQTGGFQLWKDCMADKASAWRKMVAYNKQDVALLERVYYKLQPWMGNHPHVADNRPDSCPKCGSERLKSCGIRNGYREFRCRDCEGYCRSRLREKGVSLPNKKSA